MGMLHSKNMQYAFQWEYQNAALSKPSSSELNQKLVDLLKPGDLLSQCLQWSRNRMQELEQAGACSLMMRVLYPGLLVGTGYAHKTGIMTGEIQLGFSFDYVTGLPYCPGSSLKGALRAPFARALRQGENISADAAEEYLAYLQEILQKAGASGDIGKDEIQDFCNSAFDGIRPGTEGEGIPISMRDVFYDAYPVDCDPKAHSLMGLDNITPHMDPKERIPSPLVEPVPLTMLRIMPGTCLVFPIKLHDTNRRNGNLLITANQKLEVFRQILKDFGIGAKTNVGYGMLQPVNKKIADLAEATEPPGEKLPAKTVPTSDKKKATPKGKPPTNKGAAKSKTEPDDDMEDWKRKLFNLKQSL